ncbi:acyltransferase [Idiomarina abyssalis]|uniref:Acyltransferase n=1 Tax=Idiomarina abyssalis TaxID=86102 RepID=A0A8I1G9G1_9GAMM|nr:acyltransferase family protein [Idiomarina abyssalis]MBJ7265769.1 acyltransferase [Idiomarina abyssalis]MBJ7274022.1 acyltransferase [Idiomarina abyssalis]MBJ7314872.1 acyltransferase [Idiomarina abyssalis]
MPSANFYLLPTRAWELMFGSVVALVIKKKGVVKNNYLASLGVVFIFYAIFSFDSSTPFPSLYALLPVLGSALIILYANKETLVARILSLKPVVFIGLISYSAYLWHQPLFAIKRRTELFEPSLLTMTVLGGLSLVLAAFSWKYIEAPFRNREKVSSRGIFIFSTVGLVAFSLVGGVGASQSNNLSNIGFLNPLNETINIGSYEEDNKKLQRNSWSILKSISGNPDYSVENNSFDMKPWFDDDFEGRKVLVIGNSHSKDFFNVLYSNLKQGEDFQVARFGVQIRNLESGHRLFDSPNFLSSDTIVIATRYREADVENLKWLIKFLQQAEKNVIVTNNIFEFKEYRHGVWTLADYLIFSYRKNLPSANELAQRINTEYFSEVSLNNTNARVRTLNQQIEHIVEGFESIKHYDRTSYVCDVEVGSCAAVDAKLNKYFYDYGHHTLTGAKHFGSQLDVNNILEL